MISRPASPRPALLATRYSVALLLAASASGCALVDGLTNSFGRLADDDAPDQGTLPTSDMKQRVDADNPDMLPPDLKTCSSSSDCDQEGSACVSVKYGSASAQKVCARWTETPDVVDYDAQASVTHYGDNADELTIATLRDDSALISKIALKEGQASALNQVYTFELDTTFNPTRITSITPDAQQSIYVLGIEGQDPVSSQKTIRVYTAPLDPSLLAMLSPIRTDDVLLPPAIAQALGPEERQGATSYEPGNPGSFFISSVQCESSGTNCNASVQKITIDSSPTGSSKTTEGLAVSSQDAAYRTSDSWLEDGALATLTQIGETGSLTQVFDADSLSSRYQTSLQIDDDTFKGAACPASAEREFYQPARGRAETRLISFGQTGTTPYSLAATLYESAADEARPGGVLFFFRGPLGTGGNAQTVVLCEPLPSSPNFAEVLDAEGNFKIGGTIMSALVRLGKDALSADTLLSVRSTKSDSLTDTHQLTSTSMQAYAPGTTTPLTLLDAALTEDGQYLVTATSSAGGDQKKSLFFFYVDRAGSILDDP